MKRNRKNRGFTLIELLVVISIIALLAAGAYAGYGRMMPGIKAKQAAGQAKSIWNLLSAYAQENDQSFPETENNANDAFRELFKKRLADDENLFTIAGDPWLNNAPGGAKKADNDIGTEQSDFQQAVSPGECSWAYVAGLDTASNSRLPIMASAFADGGTRYTKNKKQRGGIFSGEKAVWVTIGGSAKAVDLDTELIIKERKGGRDVDVFSADYETDANAVKNPAG